MKLRLIAVGLILLLVEDVYSQYRYQPRLKIRTKTTAAAAGGSDKCALIITGREKGCITYGAVNDTFAAARSTLQMPAPIRQSKTPVEAEVDLLGRAVVETSRLLAQQFKLSNDDVENGLSQINTALTEIGEFCPDYFRGLTCKTERFRTADGTCNNLEVSSRGATMSAFRRLIPADYADGVSAPRVSSLTGNPLPSARVVSATVHRDLGFHDHAVTTLIIAWSQMIDHDIAFGGATLDPATAAEPLCCEVDPKARHPACFQIEVPKNDPFYSMFRRRCLEFVRTETGLRDSCKLGSRGGLNVVSTYLDASHIYGLNPDQTRSLRAFRGGRLSADPALRKQGLKDVPPPKTDDPDDLCNRDGNPNIFCFLTGDIRANQQMLLTGIHILLFREHNRIAQELEGVNPHWDDERLFQETRHIMAAIVQHITYNEFLPLVLGKSVMENHDLIPLKEGYLKGYNPKIDATLSTSFFAAAYRFGHSLIPPTIERWSASNKFISAIRMSDQFFRPFEALQPGALDQFYSGMVNQVAQALDDSMTAEVTNQLFRPPDLNFGHDLASRNIQRGREHGVPSYNTFREYCGLGRADRWEDLRGVFPNETLSLYAQVYETPDDIDLWSGGISEIHKKGSMAGPVFSCIMAEGFRNLRFGDRFWYENDGWPSSFTPDQLNELRKVKLSRIICDNSDGLESVQVFAMALPSPKLNPRVPCKNSILPRINLAAWKGK